MAVVVGTAAAAAVLGVMSASAFAARSEMEVLTQQGLSRAHAERALSLQKRVAATKLASKIRTALGDAYAGVWFEPASARFHVGVTSSASRLTVMRLASEAGLASKVVATPVRSTLNALIAAQKEWNSRLTGLLESEDAMTAIAPDSNAVQVRLSASVSSSERAALEDMAAKAAVDVLVHVEDGSKLGILQEAKKTCEKKFTAFNAFCEEAITAGAGIRTPGGTKVECTAGPELISGIVTYMLTSGHCIDEEETALGDKPELFENKELASAFPANGVFKKIGNEGKRFNNKERDMAEVLVVPKGQGGAFAERLPIPVPALVAQWAATPETPHPVEGQEEAVVKQIICHEGAATGEQCGKVLALYVTGAGVENVVETSACSAGGDSGGPYFIVEKEKLLIVGMHEGKPEGAGGCGEANPRTVFEPLIGLFGAENFGILNSFSGESLLTTANENRAKSEAEEKELKEKEEKEEKEKEAKEKAEKEEKESKEKGLPDIHVLSGEKYPLHLNFSDNKKTATNLNTTAGNTLESTGVLLLFLVTELSSSGSFEILFLQVLEKKSATKCNTSGDKEGEVLLKGSFHVVRVTTSKEDAVLYSFAELSIECNKGSTKVKIKGQLLSPINYKEKGESEEFTSLCTKAEGDKKGKNSVTEYFNSSGAKTKAVLEANFGTGFAQAAEELPEICPEALEGKMFAALVR